MNQRRAVLEAICREHGVAILYSFGSRARETLAWLDDSASLLASGPSDVDLGVKRVGLVHLDSANPCLAAEIIHGDRLYAEDVYAADNYDLYIMGQVADLAFLKGESARLLLGIAT